MKKGHTTIYKTLHRQQTKDWGTRTPLQSGMDFFISGTCRVTRDKLWEKKSRRDCDNNKRNIWHRFP